MALTRTGKVFLGIGLAIVGAFAVAIVKSANAPDPSAPPGWPERNDWKTYDKEYPKRVTAAETKLKALAQALETVADSVPAGHKMTVGRAAPTWKPCLKQYPWPQQVTVTRSYSLEGVVDARPIMHTASERLAAREWHLTKLPGDETDQEWVLQKDGNILPIRAGVTDGYLSIEAISPCVHLDGSVDGAPASL